MNIVVNNPPLFALATVTMTVSIFLVFFTSIYSATQTAPTWQGTFLKVLLISPLYVVAFILFSYSIRWIYMGPYGSIWVAILMIDLIGVFGKMVPAYMLTKQVPLKGEFLGIGLMFVAVIAAIVWR